MKEISFPSLEGDFFVTFEHMKLTRFLIGCGNYLISVFLLFASFRNFHLVKEYPFAFKADFGLRKVVLRAETRFAIIELYRKNPKSDFFVILVGESFRVSGVFLRVTFGTEKLGKACN